MFGFQGHVPFWNLAQRQSPPPAVKLTNQAERLSEPEQIKALRNERPQSPESQAAGEHIRRV